jgi:hypothetical protein
MASGYTAISLHQSVSSASRVSAVRSVGWNQDALRCRTACGSSQRARRRAHAGKKVTRCDSAAADLRSDRHCAAGSGSARI